MFNAIGAAKLVLGMSVMIGSVAIGADRTAESEATAVIALVEKAIERGVPLYNDRQHEACAAVYTVAAMAVRDLTTAEGGPISPIARKVLVASLESVASDDDAASTAWTLRAALDVVHASARVASAKSDRERTNRRISELAAAVEPMRRLAIADADTTMLVALLSVRDEAADRRDLAQVIDRTIKQAEATDRPALRMMRIAAGLSEAKVAADFKPIVEADLPVGYPKPGPVGEVVVKEYPAYRAAWATGTRDNGTFMTLFNHIKRNDIAMTAPVEMTMDREGRSMTAMAFLYGEPDWGKAGGDGAVDVRDMAAATFVSIGVRGSMSADDRAWAMKQLRKRIETGGWEVAGSVRVLGYNSPFVPDAMRYSEVQIPVKKRAEEAGEDE